MAVVVRAVWVALLLALFAPRSHASEAPAEARAVQVAPAPIDFDVPRYDQTVRRWRVGLGLAVVDLAPFIVGFALNVRNCPYGCEFGGVNAMSVGLMFMGAGAVLGGSIIAVTSAWAGALVVREAGIPVSTAASFLSWFVPVAGVTAFVLSAMRNEPGTALVCLGLGYVGMLALTAGQVALNGAKTRHVRHPQFALAPTIGRAPGLALSATW